MVGREAVGLQQDRVLQRPRIDRDLPADEIGKADLARQRHLQAHDRLLPGRELALHLLLGELAAVPVVAGRHDVLRLALLAHLGQPLRRAEAVVGVPMLHQPVGRLLVEFLALALDVGAVVAALAVGDRAAIRVDLRPLVPVEAEPGQPLGDAGERALDQALAVGVLDPQHHGAAVVACEEPVEERGVRRADMEIAGRAWREAGTDRCRPLLCHRRFPSLPGGYSGRAQCAIHCYMGNATGKRPIAANVVRRRLGVGRSVTPTGESSPQCRRCLAHCETPRLAVC